MIWRAESVVQRSAYRLLLATLLALPWPGTSGAQPSPLCGNGVVDSGEDCDDGGICIGGSNAGAVCISDSECQGHGVCTGGRRDGYECATAADCDGSACVRCRTFGGEGCAANCTLEADVAYPFQAGIVEGLRLAAGTAGFVEQGQILTIPLPLYGGMRLTLGGARADGIVPFVVPAASLQTAVIPVGNLACACYRAVPLRTCAGIFFSRQGEPAQDCTDDATVCPSESPCTSVYGEGNAGAGGIDCGTPRTADSCLTARCDPETAARDCPLLETNRSVVPPSAGAARMRLTTALGTRWGACPSDPCGPTGPPEYRGVPATADFVTGEARGIICNANQETELTLDATTSGNPFNCSSLLGSHRVTDACFASADAMIGQEAIGDTVFTRNLCAARPTPTPTAMPTPGSCVGDCDADGVVTVDEIIRLIAINLGILPVDSCPGSAPCGDEGPAIDCILQAVNAALLACPTPQRSCGGIAGRPCTASEVCDIREPCNIVDAAGICVTRADACPEIYAPVCGCDGVTYSNDCERLRAGARLASAGRCPITTLERH